MGMIVLYLPIAPMRHKVRRTPKRVAITLSSFFSSVLLFEGTFMAFIITCIPIHIIVKRIHFFFVA
ncbi:hypothetical protein Hanom_Chr16g01521351 [Helianthus anomalus]